MHQELIMKIPVEISKLKGPDGIERYKAIISFQDAIADTSQSKKLILIQDEYAKRISELQNLWLTIEKDRENKASSHCQWELADAINSLNTFVESQGYFLTNTAEALSRDVGISISQINYLKKFRERYPSIEQVSERINWSKYRELMDFSDEKMRKQCEVLIKEGKIKSDSEIRAFKKKMKKGGMNVR
jgi:post-segregation antitoxin (ccd killing protein)